MACLLGSYVFADLEFCVVWVFVLRGMASFAGSCGWGWCLFVVFCFLIVGFVVFCLMVCFAFVGGLWLGILVATRFPCVLLV